MGDERSRELTGRLVRDVVAPGSKSERVALLLETDDGDVLVVRRRGEPSYGPDAALDPLAGHRVRLVGSERAGTLLVDEWTDLEADR